VASAHLFVEHFDYPRAHPVDVPAWFFAVREIVARKCVHERKVHPFRFEYVDQFTQIIGLLSFVAFALAIELRCAAVVSPLDERERGVAAELRGAAEGAAAVGTQESMMQAVNATRPGGYMGFVGVNHDVTMLGSQLFFSQIHLHGGPAPVRRYLPELIASIWNGKIHPGKVFDQRLPLEQAAEGYRAMDERRAIKTLLTV
jgi:threonine dehydrogenase-like Zn-dependent dehydrogenase